jgi:hypothetical protein
MKDPKLATYYHKILAHHSTEIMRLKNSKEEYRFENIALLTDEIRLFSNKLVEVQ